MRKIVVAEFLSLDGVMEDPGGAEKFQFGGWTRPYWSDEIGKFKTEELMNADAHLLGRVTYEGFAKAWPNMTDAGEFGDRMNNLPKYEVSGTLKTLAWNNSHLLKKNFIEDITDLKQQPGADILVAGSAMLVNALIEHNLVDEFHLLIYPVVLGNGKRLFAYGCHAPLKLVRAQALDSGVVAHIYQSDGK